MGSVRNESPWPAGKLLLRDTALRLYAERGPDAVSVREVAAAAGVSPGLVVHHFGTKDALRAAVDDHVTALLEALLAGLGDLAQEGSEPDLAAGTAGLLLAHLGPDSPVPAYLRRLLVAGEGAPVFARWYRATLEATERLRADGLLTDTRDPEARAAFLLVNDLAVFLLRDRLHDVLGFDPLGPDGAQRWAATVVEAYRGGVLAADDDEEDRR